MLSTDELIAYASASMDTVANEELQQRLSLYRVFSKLYEHHRSLLDEILSLENSGSKALGSVALPYVQGVVLHQQVYLVTNLLEGKTQALMQPQQTWMIGRDTRKVSISIQDTRLSRCHAMIQYAAGEGFSLVDLGSRNGSFVNGERVWRSAPLKDGDQVRLGSLSFVFFICQTAKALAPLPSTVSAAPKSLPSKRPVSADKPEEPLSAEPLTHLAEEPAAPVANPLQETFTFMRRGRFEAS